jgi:hypothetical protein
MVCVAQQKQRPRNKRLPEDHRIETSGQVEGQGLAQSPPVVFEAVKAPIAPVSPGFAPIDSLYGDDDRVRMCRMCTKRFASQKSLKVSN